MSISSRDYNCTFPLRLQRIVSPYVLSRPRIQTEARILNRLFGSLRVADLYFVISESNKRIFSSEVFEVRKGMPSLCIPLDHTIALTGDIRVDFFNRPKMKRKVSNYFILKPKLYEWFRVLTVDFAV